MTLTRCRAGGEGGVALEVVADQEEDGGVRKRSRPEERITVAAFQSVEIEEFAVDLGPEHARVEAIVEGGGLHRGGERGLRGAIEVDPGRGSLVDNFSIAESRSCRPASVARVGYMSK